MYFLVLVAIVAVTCALLLLLVDVSYTCGIPFFLYDGTCATK